MFADKARKEPVFLQIGNHLRDFSSRSRELSGRAESCPTQPPADMQRAMRELNTSQQELFRAIQRIQDNLGFHYH